MSYCRNCGAKLEDSVIFCTKCGTPVDIIPSQNGSQQSRENIRKKQNGEHKGSSLMFYVTYAIAAFIIFGVSATNIDRASMYPISLLVNFLGFGISVCIVLLLVLRDYKYFKYFAIVSIVNTSLTAFATFGLRDTPQIYIEHLGALVLCVPILFAVWYFNNCSSMMKE